MTYLFLKNIGNTLEKSLNKKMIIPCLFVLLLLPIFTIPNNADAANLSCFTSVTQTITGNYKGGVFVDSYWTDKSASNQDDGIPKELEVGPGEGPSTLAVVLQNTSDEELYAVTGYLKLPQGIIPYGLSADPDTSSVFYQGKGSSVYINAAQASYPGTVTPGGTITLYFDLNILDNAIIGTYGSSLIADYTSENNRNSCKSALIQLPFILPGKVILDVIAKDKYLFPNTSNPVNITITNKGSGDATGVVATIVGLGESGSRGSASGSSLTLESSDTNLVNLGSNTFNIGTIPAGKSIDISTILFPDNTAASTVQNIDLEITYGNSYGYKQTIILTSGLVITPTPAESTLIISSSSEFSPPIVTAGNVMDYGIEIKNTGVSQLTDIVFTLTGDSDALEIVGNSKWYVDLIEPGETYFLTAEIFADTSMINSPTSFTFTSDYISNGELKTDTSTLGAYVSGDINLVLYDVEVNKIGDSLYVVGNVLNQGSTTGKFANIELTSFLGPPSQGNPQTANQEILTQNNPEQKLIPQYLGDLTEDSVIPFSIPLSIPVLSSGIYPLTFKITYADDLKNFHEIVLEKEVNVNQILQVAGENQGSRSGSSSTMFTLAILGLTGVLIASVVFVVKKKKFSKLKLKNDNNFEDDDYIENLLDSATEENQQQKNNVK